MDSNILLIIALLKALLTLFTACYNVGIALVTHLTARWRKPAPKVSYRLARAATLRASSDRMQRNYD